MKMTINLMGAAAISALAAGAALADPAIIYDLGGKFDKSFNEMAYTGAQRWADETGGSFGEIELTSEAQREQALIEFAEEGYDPVVMTGFTFVSSLSDIAPDFPDTTFVLIDEIADLPNVRSVVFGEHEGSYLVGVAAATASKTAKVGFVGGMDIGLIQKFACGYVQGVKATNPDAEVVQNYVGLDASAWNNPAKAGEITRAQKGNGADVIYAAAGGSGDGVINTAADEGIFSIGVDKNQNWMKPGSVLTSMVKRVDLAVYEAFMGGEDLETGTFVMDLSNGGVDYAVDEYNAPVFSDDIKAAVEAAKQGIVDGSIAVHNYLDDNSCPVQ